ncbi:hypothetical protein NPX13_g2732 [Xylaria arbuscula]|uniref:Uncharacterized protein n=1 Tax=Xylaria arbuscula TaxID=114810 RepID=A0A9W8NIM5_9PEZI|nr:hypothetical protein NPX13_g2732 [Xylaria arbuscula]
MGLTMTARPSDDIPRQTCELIQSLMDLIEAIHHGREVISKLLSVVHAPKRTGPAAEGAAFPTVGALGLLPVTSHFSRSALITGCRGVVLVAGPLALARVSVMSAGCACIAMRGALVAARVAVVIVIGGVGSLTGKTPALGKGHQSRYGSCCAGVSDVLGRDAGQDAGLPPAGPRDQQC